MPAHETQRYHAIPASGCPREHAPAALGSPGDLGLIATIFATALAPLACALAGVGRWGGASLGIGAAGVLLAGRELVSTGLACLRARAAGDPERAERRA